MEHCLRIAIADDERDMREFLQEALTRMGHDVIVAAADGNTLLERCNVLEPDLIITDIKMPRLDGIDATSAVNRQRQVPVILVSAHHDAELLARVGTDMIMGYLVKPVKEADLRAAIAVGLARFQNIQALATESADLRRSLEDRKLTDRAKGIVMKRLRLDEDEAYRRLRKLASNHNHKLIEVVQEVVQADGVFQDLDRV